MTEPTVAPPREWRALLRTVRSSPQYAPERIARYAARTLGPRARSSAEKLSRAHPELSGGDLQRKAAERGIRTAILEGSLLGGPFMLLWPPAFCAALVAQLQMVLTLAALSGNRSDDEGLAADLLVLQGACPDPAAARRALAATAAEAAGPGPDGGNHDGSAAERTPGSRAGWWSTGRRLAHLIGLLTPADGSTGTRSRARQLAGWIGIALLCAVGFVAPLVWLPASAEMYRRATTGLATRTLAHYAVPAGAAGAAADLAGYRWVLRPGTVAVALRALVAFVLTVAVLLAVLLADLRLATSHLLAALVLLFAASALGYTLLRGRGRSGRR